MDGPYGYGCPKSLKGTAALKSLTKGYGCLKESSNSSPTGRLEILKVLVFFDCWVGRWTARCFVTKSLARNWSTCMGTAARRASPKGTTAQRALKFDHQRVGRYCAFAFFVVTLFVLRSFEFGFGLGSFQHQ